MSKVLVSWIARRADPYERHPDDTYRRSKDQQLIWGPTLTLLFDPTSPYYKKIDDIVFFYRVPTAQDGEDPKNEIKVAKQTIEEVKKKSPQINIHEVPWSGSDPTDHLSIFNFLKVQVPKLREEFFKKELVVHISPGTPSMHTIWILLAETGFIDSPFTVVKSYREKERRNRGVIVPVKIGLETFFQVYRKSQILSSFSEDEELFWDPTLFKSPSLKKLYQSARHFARLKVPILLLGERGTGKTKLASWIRSNSPYRQEKLDDKWPSVVCGQYSPQMMRGELFGYEKGAFTDAKKKHTGLIKVADGDSLFLDEIGDISRDLQRLLIRALEEGIFLPLGASSPIKSNFRLITATNRSWKELENSLDLDFLDRISIFRLKLPALREIPEDIPWLWEKVWQQAVHRSGIEASNNYQKNINHKQIANLLQNHPLPGNLRDLFRVAYHLIAFSDNDVQTASDELIEEILKELSNTDLDQSLQSVANAMSKQQSLESLILPNSKLPAKQLEQDFKRYLAREIRRIAKIKGESVENLCDIKERTLLNWSK